MAFSIFGGSLMVAAGVLYLAFEKSILSRSIASKKQIEKVDGTSRLIMGIQVCS